MITRRKWMIPGSFDRSWVIQHSRIVLVMRMDETNIESTCFLRNKANERATQRWMQRGRWELRSLDETKNFRGAMEEDTIHQRVYFMRLYGPGISTLVTGMRRKNLPPRLIRSAEKRMRWTGSRRNQSSAGYRADTSMHLYVSPSVQFRILTG